MFHRFAVTEGLFTGVKSNVAVNSVNERQIVSLFFCRKVYIRTHVCSNRISATYCRQQMDESDHQGVLWALTSGWRMPVSDRGAL